MKYCHIVGNDSVTRGRIKPVSPRLRKSTSHPEDPGSAHHRQLPDRVQSLVQPKNANGAAIVDSIAEPITQSHYQTKPLLTRRPVQPLGATHEFGTQVGSFCEGVVRH